MLVLALIGRAWAIRAELTNAVPREHLAVVFVDRPDAEIPASSPAPNIMPSLLGQLRTAGVLGAAGGSTAILTDVLTSLGVLEATPFAVVLTDLEVARESTGSPPQPSLRLDSLGAALVVHTRGENNAIAQQIRTLLQSWTASDQARVEREESSGLVVYTLIDQRAPRWARVHWAAVGDYYIIAIGDEAFAGASGTIARKDTSFAGDGWVQQNKDRVDLDRAEVAWAVDFRRLRARLREDASRTGALLDSLGLQNTQRGLWTVRKEHRAIVAAAAYSTPEGDLYRPLTLPVGEDRVLAQAIPVEADAYAVFPTSAADLVARARAAYLATCSPPMRELLTEHWSAFMTATHLDLEGDLLAHLGDRIVVHTFPHHPLGVRIFVTILVEVDGPAASVRRAVDTILMQCDRWMAGRPDETGRPPDRGWFAPRLRRTEDGVWSLHVGITGPAIAVTERWVVISFSPVAVRECLAKMNAAASEAVP